ncbi:hypothetical protein DFH29DRAFT_1000436 [Suillus ampliporus]|nr:hypothetical protein DFH29DRAFT_1000436 [Suillus ampliporus]
MSHPQTRPSNVNKHPGNIVREANRVQWRSKEEVAAEKNRKQAEKNACAAAVDKSRTMVAAAEDAMAIQQKTQVKGPPKLIRPRMVTSKKSTNVANADAQPAVIVQSTAAPEDDGQAGQPVKKKRAALKLNFRDSVNANRKVSNGGVTIITGDSDTCVGSTTIELTLYYFDYICAHQISTNPKQVISSNLKGPIPNWVDKIASQTQLKPSAPPSARTSVRTGQIAESDVDLDDEPEEYKSSADELEVLNAAEELEILEDLEAAEEFEMVEDRESAEEGDESDTAMMVDRDQPTIISRYPSPTFAFQLILPSPSLAIEIHPQTCFIQPSHAYTTNHNLRTRSHSNDNNCTYRNSPSHPQAAIRVPTHDITCPSTPPPQTKQPLQNPPVLTTTISATHKGISAMPGPGSSKAPAFNGETLELLEFLELFEDLASSCALTDADKCKMIVQYVNLETKRFWVMLTGYKSKDFGALKTNILGQYSGAAKGARYTIRDLECVVLNTAESDVSTETELLQYYRQFRPIAVWLVTNSKISIRERDRYFWQGLPHAARVAIGRQLELKEVN